MAKLPLHPWYDKSKLLFYFVWIFLILYAVGFLVLFAYIQNNSLPYDWFRNSGMPGATLSTTRGSFLDVTIRLMCIAHVLLCGVIASMIMFRKDFGYNVIWIICISLAIIVTLLSIFTLTQQYIVCNQDNQYGNMCNSLNYCNVNEIRANPLNGCSDTAPSPSPVLWSSLSPRVDFLGLYWTNVVLFALQCIYLSVISYYWSLDDQEIPEDDDQEEEETEEEEEPPRPQPKPIKVHLSTPIKSHGLRQRK